MVLRSAMRRHPTATQLNHHHETMLVALFTLYKKLNLLLIPTYTQGLFARHPVPISCTPASSSRELYAPFSRRTSAYCTARGIIGIGITNGTVV
jgi:hypothetical protein